MYDGRHVIVHRGMLEGTVAKVDGEDGTEISINPIGRCTENWCDSDEDVEDDIPANLASVNYSIMKENVKLLSRRGDAFQIVQPVRRRNGVFSKGDIITVKLYN